MLTDVACSIAAGGVDLSDIEALRANSEVFGPVASDTTALRALGEIGDVDLYRIDEQRAAARAHLWSLLPDGVPPSTYAGGVSMGEAIVLRADGTITLAHSDKEHAEGTSKKSYGFHSLGVWIDNTGELFVKSDMLFEGYASGEDTKEIDGFLSIGDVGHLDDEGRLFVEGRGDDMVVIGGENVYPAEIEDVIDGMDGVDDVAVIGVNDDEFGEVLAAFVVGSVDPDAVKETAEKELASFKVPKRVEIVDDLPRTSTGKVRKKELLEEHDAEEADAG